jgi:hypothetical protein
VTRENSVLCTDGNLSSVERVKTFDHLEHMNNFTQRWKGWLKRFHGVGLARVDNYLGWFRFMDEREEFQDIAWVQGPIPSLEWPANM